HGTDHIHKENDPEALVPATWPTFTKVLRIVTCQSCNNFSRALFCKPLYILSPSP
ncbi:hypothetical protein NDU88_002645, partial [Pleurodeles waltl]